MLFSLGARKHCHDPATVQSMHRSPFELLYPRRPWSESLTRCLCRRCRMRLDENAPVADLYGHCAEKFNMLVVSSSALPTLCPAIGPRLSPPMHFFCRRGFQPHICGPPSVNTIPLFGWVNKLYCCAGRITRNTGCSRSGLLGPRPGTRSRGSWRIPSSCRMWPRCVAEVCGACRM